MIKNDDVEHIAKQQAKQRRRGDDVGVTSLDEAYKVLSGSEIANILVKATNSRLSTPSIAFPFPA